MLQQIAPKCHLSGGTASSVANEPWLARSYHTARRSRNHRWRRHGGNAQLANSSNRCCSWRHWQMWDWFAGHDFIDNWPPLAKRWSKCSSRPLKSISFCLWLSGHREGRLLLVGLALSPEAEEGVCPQTLINHGFVNRADHSYLARGELQPDSLVWRKVWSPTLCVSLADWDIMIHIALVLKVLHLLFDTLILSLNS